MPTTIRVSRKVYIDKFTLNIKLPQNADVFYFIEISDTKLCDKIENFALKKLFWNGESTLSCEVDIGQVSELMDIAGAAGHTEFAIELDSEIEAANNGAPVYSYVIDII